MTQQPDPWRCSECDVHYPIQPLARRCEQTHREEAEDATAH